MTQPQRQPSPMTHNDDDTNTYMEMEGGSSGTGTKTSPAMDEKQQQNNKKKDGLDDETATTTATMTMTRGFWNQLRAFRSMAVPYFRTQRRARCYFAIMIVLTLLNSGVRVVFSYLARDFWSALSDNRSEDFYRVMKLFLISMAVLAPINVLYRYQRQLLAIHWRQWMTSRTLSLYFTNRVYYGLELNVEKSDHDSTTRTTDHLTTSVVDNPDQRIAEDVRSFTEFSLTLFLTVVMAVVDLICFSIILFSIMPQLFIAIIAFAALGTIATVIIGKTLVQLNFEKLQKEANFRFSLVRVREHAESIAFMRGENVEQSKVNTYFERVIQNMHALNRAVRNLEFFTNYYTYLTWVLPILVVAPKYFAGNVELGVVQQAAASFSHVLDDMSILVTQWESLTEFSAGIDRLYTFLKVSEDLLGDPGGLSSSSSSERSPLMVTATKFSKSAKQEEIEEPQWISLEEQPSPISSPPKTEISLHQVRNSQQALRIHNLTLTTPHHHHHNHHHNSTVNKHQRILVQNLNLEVSWNQNLLICGASGTGKSSLLRAIAGLWKAGSGSISRPNDNDIYFLPQKPYCAVGSLRDQLLYPRTTSYLDPAREGNNTVVTDTTGSSSIMTDDQLLHILRMLNLAELPMRAGDGNPIRGLDTVMDWSNILSLGEQQRLAFGRILVNRPLLVVLDESTSALDIESERRMYALLEGMMVDCGDGNLRRTSYVSVGHRPSLTMFHTTKLTLQGSSFSIEPIHQSGR